MSNENKKGKGKGTVSTETDVPSSGAVAKITGIFALSVAANTAGKKVKKLTLPPIISPKHVQDGISIQGRIDRVTPSPVATYKSELLVMTHPSGTQFCFPATSVVEKALIAYINEKTGGDSATLKDAVGVEIIVAGLGSTKTKDGKRDVNLFEVSVVE